MWGILLWPLTGLPGTSTAQSTACASRVNNTQAKLQECVTLEAARAHQAALQALADDNDDTRAAGTPGYDASVSYVIDRLSEAGYTVELDEFEITYIPPVTLQQTAPVVATYESGAFTGSGFGELEGPVIPVDLALADPAASTSGCEASDFAGLDFSGPADIALVQRGACNFSTKAVNAQSAGAKAVIIFNQGNDPTRLELIIGTVANLPDGSPSNLTIPVVGASFEQGQAFSQPASIAFIDVDPPETRIQVNVLAELPGRNHDNVIMVGAHLDSVQAGPGIQDNGSGSAAILEVATQMASVKPRNTVRFAWWGGEELGLVGSTAYVEELSEDELADIALYLNFDMIGSPNYVFFIYDGDDSEGIGAGPGPEGSAQIETFFENFYSERGYPFEPTDFSGRSDYGPFIVEGIPAGGLFTGAEGIKTPEQALLFGGTAGDQYDPCYHLACDTVDNISLEAFDINIDAVAASTLQFAMNTVTVNGVRGKGNFKPKGPQPEM